MIGVDDLAAWVVIILLLAALGNRLARMAPRDRRDSMARED